MTALSNKPMDSTYPVTVMGGGLAGCAAATILAKAGWTVALLERETFPRDKLCGEFLSGESARLLTKVGCWHELLRHDPPVITRARFISTSGRSIEVELPEPAYGISRRLLDKTLFDHACSSGVEGATFCEVLGVNSMGSGHEISYRRKINGTSQEGAITSGLSIGTYGRRARPDYDLRRSFTGKISKCCGFKMHHHFRNDAVGEQAKRDLAGITEIYGLSGGYCGINLVEGEKVNVCMLLQQDALRLLKSRDWADISSYLKSHNLKLGKRLDALVPADEKVLVVSGMPFGTKDVSLDGVLFAGDAAGMIAPLCGDGQAMALESGIRLAELIKKTYPEANALPSNTEMLQKNWSREWNKQFRLRMKVGRVLQYLLLRPMATDLAISVLNTSPSAAQKLAQLTRTTYSTAERSAA